MKTLIVKVDGLAGEYNFDAEKISSVRLRDTESASPDMELLPIPAGGAERICYKGCSVVLDSHGGIVGIWHEGRQIEFNPWVFVTDKFRPVFQIEGHLAIGEDGTVSTDPVHTNMDVN